MILTRKVYPQLAVVIATVAAVGALSSSAVAATPTPTITITTPVAGASYAPGSTVLAQFSCTNATSCVGTFANGSPIYTAVAHSATGGYYSFKVTAKGSNGKTVTKSANYNVAPPAGCPAGYVALTYDDGPTSMTQQYVNALVTGGAKATFFDLGVNMANRPVDVQYTVAAGMAVQNHTWDHQDLTSLSDAGIASELTQQMNEATSLGVPTENIYRPPYGAENGNTWDVAFSLGLTELTWTMDTQDWQGLSASQITQTAVDNAHDQAIILMHDGYPNTLAAVPQILSQIAAKGLCPGKIVPSWDAPILNEWGWPLYAQVVPW